MTDNRGAFLTSQRGTLRTAYETSGHDSESRKRSQIPGFAPTYRTRGFIRLPPFQTSGGRRNHVKAEKCAIPSDGRRLSHRSGRSSLYGGAFLQHSDMRDSHMPFHFRRGSPPAHERRLLSDVLSGCRLGVGLLSHGANMAGFAPLVRSL